MNRRDFLRTAGGAAGAATAAAAGAGPAVAQEEGEDGGGGGGNVQPEWPDYLSDANDTGYEDLRGSDEVSVSVVNNEFDPTKIWVDPGTTVTWEFEDPTHNVKPNEQPADDLQGTPGGRNDPVAEGETYQASLETAGMYSYFCGPHETMGMKGAVAVGDEVPTVDTGGDGGGGGGGEVDPEHMGVPFHPHYVGVSTVVMMVVSLVFTFFLLKYAESPNAKGGNN